MTGIVIFITAVAIIAGRKTWLALRRAGRTLDAILAETRDEEEGPC